MTTSDSTLPFSQAGEMARRIREFDWERTEIGPPDGWPPDLRAVVNLVLDCRIPMMLGWGPELRLIYNDGYIPILGDKHPVMWETGEAVFEELWHYVGPLLNGVYESGEAIKRDNELLPLQRRGYLEDCYFTLSYSPLREASGRVAGVLSTAIETTAEVLAARREGLLSSLGVPAGAVHPEEAVKQSCVALQGARDVPFHVALLRDDKGYRMVAADGASMDEATHDDAGWTALARHDGAPVPVERLPGVRVHESASARCTHAVVRPLGRITDLEDVPPAGVLVLGIPRELPWDEPHQAFLNRLADLVSGQFDTQRLRALLVAEAEDRYHELFIQALDGIILGKPDGSILAANPAACRILGYTEAELIQGGRQLVQDPDDPRWVEGVARRARQGSFTGELTWRHSSGKRVTCEVTSSTFPDAEGGLRSTVILRDVTERLLLEARLAEARKMEVVGRISGGIAHDFNNLLAVIDVQTDLLRDELANRPDALRDLDLLTQTSQRAAGLIRRLLDFTRRSHGEPRRFNPAITVTEMAPLLRRLVGSGAELDFDIDDETPDLVMAPHQFEQVLMNLVVNARDAVDEVARPGRIQVRVGYDPAASEVLLAVRDDGVGIPESKLHQIFDAFYTTKSHGTGIGLNTVRTLAEDLGGSVSVESTEGSGSLFTVRLPAAEGTVAETAEKGQPLPAGRLDGVDVMLVEDQAHLRTVLSRVLSRAGARVTPAANGEEALRLAVDHPPDVLVSDVVMPLLSGPELVRRLQSERPDLAIVLMSGYAGEEIVPTELLESSRFLHKPFAAEALVTAVREALAGR